ncbi:Glycosyltransferase involved in cell wall bisynthesis [Thalassococcus halodurans]|uniref:Glycosyltransferase involved in cell wall bisynthesis n=1 Tax=Thalassococcus halodurans TaxID=373675 RepID=A0A1H5XE26_9RHOB|nr:glycosyltransferase [Thalassococcus halodurans]SEG10018.1 Glycosyltransferase involved in cell wall bisynthesis [Thalassococcus halodurans]
MSRILFITWDGPQTSYLEGLFLPIFKALAKHGHHVHVLQFTWANADSTEYAKNICEASGIPYRAAPIWRNFGSVGPFASAVLGRSHILRAIRDWNIDTLMPRSLMPALAILMLGYRRELKLIFDADGFAVDERVDFGRLSPESATYRILRAVETHIVRVADRVLVRTPRAIDILVDRSKTDRAKFHVVGNGRDPTPFLSGWPRRIDNEFRLCYAGSLGSQYCPDQMMAVAQCLRFHIPNLVFRIFTGDKANLDAALDRLGVYDRSWIEVSRLPPGDMPAALMQCDLALALRQPAFSTQGVAPIKLGEYMLAGLPVIGTEGVGLVDPLIASGVMFPLKEDLSQVWPWVRDNVISHQNSLRERAQALGLAHFSLKTSVDSYLPALNTDIGASPCQTF